MNTPETQAGANTYILHMLLQRLETQQPGLVLDLLQGAKADQASFQTQGQQPAGVSQVFDAVITMLERIHAQNQQAA